MSTDPSTEQSLGGSRSGGSTAVATTRGGAELITDHGKTTIADSVVAKVAGIGAREMSGVHAMGAGGARALGSIRGVLPGQSSDSNPTQGVSVEVGERQAAIDLDLVVEYGVSIPEVAEAVRQNVIRRVERLTGLEVTEVNVAVDDIYLGDEASGDGSSRVE